MFIISNQFSRRVCGESCFSCTRESEKERHISCIPFVGTTVHGEYICPRHQIVHQCKDTLFHLAGIWCSQYDHFLSLKTECDAGCTFHSFNGGIGWQTTCIVDGEIRFAESGQFFFCGTDQHVVHKECMVRQRADDSDFQSVFRIPSSITINRVSPGLFI